MKKFGLALAFLSLALITSMPPVYAQEEEQTVIGIALFIVRGAMWRIGGFFNDMLFPYVRIILLIVTMKL